MNKFRFLTSGESHGICLNAIIEGLPSNIFIDKDFIDAELARRQQGYGRGGRMQIETDKVQIKSGVRFSKTTGPSGRNSIVFSTGSVVVPAVGETIEIS